MKSFASRALVVAGALGLGGAIAGCEILTTFDRSLVDAGTDYDAAPYDATYPDVESLPDSNGPDTADASARADGDAAGGIDASDAAADAHDAGDANAPDVADGNAPDTSDANEPDTSDSSAGDDSGDATGE